MTTLYSDDNVYDNKSMVTSFIGDNGYPQPEIVAITTGVPTLSIKRDVNAKPGKSIGLNVLPEEDEENIGVL